MSNQSTAVNMPNPPAFRFPLPTPLANDRVKLIPFEPDLHSAAFVAGSGAHPEAFAHMPGGPFETVAALHAAIASPDGALSASDPANLLLAVVDRTRPPSPEDEDGELAGIATYLDASPGMRSAEIGLVVLPAYQRAHVATNVVGLMLGCAFAPAARDGGGDGAGRGGLGLVRVTWMCSAANEASANLAEKMGFTRVGLIPYHYRFALGKKTGKVGNGRALPPGSDPDDLWRDTILYSMSWEGWAEAREKVEKAMAR